MREGTSTNTMRHTYIRQKSELLYFFMVFFNRCAFMAHAIKDHRGMYMYAHTVLERRMLSRNVEAFELVPKKTA